MTAKNKYYKKIGIHYEKIMLDPTGRKIKKNKATYTNKSFKYP